MSSLKSKEEALLLAVTPVIAEGFYDLKGAAKGVQTANVGESKVAAKAVQGAEESAVRLAKKSENALKKQGNRVEIQQVVDEVLKDNPYAKKLYELSNEARAITHHPIEDLLKEELSNVKKLNDFSLTKMQNTNLHFSGESLLKISDKNLELFSNFGFRIDELYNAANAKINKEGMTRAGRALCKHSQGQRKTGTFTPLKGNTSSICSQAEDEVRRILTHPYINFKFCKNGSLEVRLPNGQGLKFSKKIENDIEKPVFKTFLDKE